ncbi:YtxH domain-containing protein [Jeotgalibacillus proteolyticus]|uniref:YtxH domain-containing protein n=1 Tax=Jeotgalibacillus proteolyticus TaxID=2082395 RepID=A0A2S5GCJ2_9BACL|nr:YtxH domain-containing protein [Jeotgalibacillus proteolyticus]PPA70720.1 hypothetical protein C4B60_07955 [Jeotgalibacillus proteolyticus]
MEETQRYSTNSQQNSQNEKNGKFLKGILIGAAVGGAITLLDSNTRKKVTSGSRGVKDSTMGLVSKVKENPSEVKNDLQERIMSAVSTLKTAMNDAQNLYQKVNDDVVPQIEDIKENASDIVSTAVDTKDEIKNIGSQVTDAGSEVAAAGSELTDNEGSSSSNQSTGSQSASLNQRSAQTTNASPQGDIPGSRGRDS